MAGSGFKMLGLRQLLGAGDAGQDDDEDDAGQGGNPVTQQQIVEAARSDASAAATSAAAKATADANARWNAVMTSDAGQAHPKAAARLLSTGTQSAEDVIATLDDMSGSMSGSRGSEQGQHADNGRRGSAGVDRDELRDDRDTQKSTGGAASAQGQRDGGGRDDDKGQQHVKSARDRRRERREEAGTSSGARSARGTRTSDRG